jgi:hypothetical protein
MVRDVVSVLYVLYITQVPSTSEVACHQRVVAKRQSWTFSNKNLQHVHAHSRDGGLKVTVDEEAGTQH